ncbi:MAG TPA: Xaa-Pro peptidase family protein [Candidatus Bathyarchaeia archaeon]|nr:Xaa-Pro peptidase family protein [Candidatus Bathyarchaeia archaeon]
MIADIDREMEARNIDSLIVFGDSTVGNPDLGYVVGASLPRGGIYLKRKSQPPTLVVSNIDIGSARQGRVKNIRKYSDYGFERLRAKYSADDARSRFYQKLAKETGLSGKVVVAGRNDLANSLFLIDSLRKKGLRIVGERTPTILESARETKDSLEANRLKGIAVKTDRVVEKTIQGLRNARVTGAKVILKSQMLKVGTVRGIINHFLADEKLIAPEDTIVAPGRKSSDPHYRGEDTDYIHAREPIVYDIFPCEPDGYWHDCTRTFCFGNPSRRLREMYEAVSEAQADAFDMVREEVPGKALMLRTCELFEKRSYDTPRTVKGGMKGFIHGLGHGVGLTIGERPYLNLYNNDPLRKGSVVTIEPGLYDPRIGGVRIEDTVLVGSPSKRLTNVEKFLEL